MTIALPPVDPALVTAAAALDAATAAARDSTPSWLFRNQHDGTFRQEGLERGVALSEDGLEQAGMGIGLGDVDLDGGIGVGVGRPSLNEGTRARDDRGA